MRLVKQWLVILLAMSMLTGLIGCGSGVKKPDGNTITVYLSDVSYLAKYAPYIQAQLPDMDIRFIVGRSTVEFYEFMQQNDDLPDIIMVGSLSLRDSLELNQYLLDLSTTETAAAYHNNYLERFRCEDGSIRWLPAGGVIHGLLANQDLFDQYGIALPTDYDSFVAACDAFATHGVRGFVSDYKYDYTCLYTLEGWSIPELMGLHGTGWQYDYSNGLTDQLDETLWTGIFEKTETFIQDVGLLPEDTARGYTATREDMVAANVAMVRGTTNDIDDYSEYGNIVMLPYFGETEDDNWLLTQPAFHVALNGRLAEDEERQGMALEVLEVMLSAEAMDILAEEYLYIQPYNQENAAQVPEMLQNLAPLIDANHMYILQDSSALYTAATIAVQGLLTGEYNAQSAYEVANNVLGASLTEQDEEMVFTLETAYSADFLPDEGNQAASTIANTMRTIAQTDLFLAPASLSTGSLYACEYTQTQLENAFQSSGNRLFTCHDLTGAEVREIIRLSVEGCGLPTDPFSRETLPVASGLTMTVEETGDTYVLGDISVNGALLDDGAVYSMSIVDVPDRVQALTEQALGTGGFERFTSSGDIYARTLWMDYLMEGNLLEMPAPYIKLK